MINESCAIILCVSLVSILVLQRHVGLLDSQLAMNISRRTYLSRWENRHYRREVERLSSQLESDGCTGVPELFHLGCLEHDIGYRLGEDPYGFTVDREEADRRFRWYMQSLSSLGRLSPTAWSWWIAVRLAGSVAWENARKENFKVHLQPPADSTRSTEEN